MTRRTVVVAVGVSAVGDLAGLAHQALSGDHPPIPAMVLSGALALVALLALRPLAAGRRRARWLAFGSRAGDVLLLTGAAASGHVFGEPTDHVVLAVVQFLLSLLAAFLVARKVSDATAPKSDELMTTSRA